jgi:FixJ family two-component response regulator
MSPTAPAPRLGLPVDYPVDDGDGARDALQQRQTRDARRQRLAELTDREAAVMRHVTAGRPNKLMADELCISACTVEVHRARAFEKMNVKSAVELDNLLRQAGAGVQEGSDGR